MLSLGVTSINDLYKSVRPNFSLESIYSNVNCPSSSLFNIVLFIVFNINYFNIFLSFGFNKKFFISSINL